MEVRAISKGVRISPRKVSEVASLVRNRSVEEALTILKHTPRRAAIPVIKTIESAKANADYNHNLKPDSLHLSEITVTQGPRFKRRRPVAKGMSHQYMHRTSHIRVMVKGDVRTPKKQPQTAAVKKETK